MKRLAWLAAALLVATLTASAVPTAAGDGILSIGKISEYLHDRDKDRQKRILDDSLAFEMNYRDWGAATNEQKRAKQGFYYDVRWNAKEPVTDVVVRFEYRQRETRDKVMVLEQRFAEASGGQHSAFQVIGKAYEVNGSVMCWRVQLIRGGQVIAEKRSFLW